MAAQNRLELQRFFASVWEMGVGQKRHIDLLLLLGRKRMTPSVWVEVHEIWREVRSEFKPDTSPLLVGEAAGVWAFAYGEGLTTSEGSWFKDVRERANLPLDDSEAA
jgi:hypothetical protein